ncbi:fumarylacetoacetate hydrolase family protein [Granulosicoccaceae sp. 1_MG-2023]|nr:fumarylacetoacetate hydrolase family protein [Granulosicoccaceae sp. 1_MG-2023]
MAFPFTPPQQISLAIYGGPAIRYPVNNIYCVARNYADHAIEMGHDPEREAPFFFMKPANALSGPGDNFIYPDFSEDVHHEVEMVVGLQSGGRNLSEEEALACIYGYGVGLDMTARDRQAELKKAGRPWELAKGFSGAAVCSAISPLELCDSNPDATDISLSINGELRQQGNTAQMIWKTAELISTLSRYFPLEAGDLIYTGTPAGVGPVKPGDHLVCTLEGIAAIELDVV